MHPAANIAPFSGPRSLGKDRPARGLAAGERWRREALRFADRPAGALLSRHGCVALLVKGWAIHCGARLPLTTQKRSKCHNISGGEH